MNRQGIIELFEEILPYSCPVPAASQNAAPVELSKEQQAAFEKLHSCSVKNEFSTSLLFGVTGSGKTQVYLKLIDDTIKRGRNAIVLVPEISLTPQTVDLFKIRFGESVAVLHSSLSVGERLEEWRRIKAGAASIVVGTRSAVFAPLDNIGLIVIDEEQEHTYHSENSPRYHARDIARFRARHHNAHLLLCSATPSIESYHHAINGRYNLVSLPLRYSGARLPDVQIIDMRTSVLSAFSTALSQELSEQLRETIERKEQAILLLNRRGYNTLIKCSSCGEVARCPHCSVPLTFHYANNRLICHYCGYSKSEKSLCPTCQSPMMRFSGVGTQKVEEELHSLFPGAGILRMDMDTTMSRFSHERGFAAFSKGDYDIMIGTQMVAKGLDFPNVTSSASFRPTSPSIPTIFAPMKGLFRLSPR
jgi:primosomal protein N' (replication factor Y)